MISNSDKRLLRETYKNASAAVDTIYAMMDKVEDEELALDLTRQLGKYTSIQDRAEEELIVSGERPAPSAMKRVWCRVSSFVRTMGKRKASTAANMLIRENTGRIISTTKSLHDNLSAKKEYCELADELMEFEQRNISRMKNYL